MARGDVRTVTIPPPAARAGREQFGHRPAVVVQAQSGPSTTMIVPFTSNLNALSLPHTFRVDPSSQNGLTKPSVLLVSQLRAIDNGRLGKAIGHLEGSHMERLEDEMRLLLGL